MTSHKQGKVTREVRAVLCIFSDRISVVFVRLVFSTELSWNQILMKLGEAITLRYEEHHFKRFSGHLEYSVCSGNWRLLQTEESWAVFPGYVWLNNNVYNKKIQTFLCLCLCITITFDLNLYLSKITPVELVLWHKLN